MRIVHISDTHTMHRQVKLPEGDLLVHSGDLCGDGTLEEVAEFYEWLGELQFKHVLIVPGNHDFCFDPKHARYDDRVEDLIAEHADKVRVLRDGKFEFEGVKFYGNSSVPWLHGWAFYDRNTDQFSESPQDVDVLVTHGPAYGVLDRVLNGEHVGSSNLRRYMKRCTNLLLHMHGHIHEARDVIDQTHEHPLPYLASNAAICDRNYNPTGPAQCFDFDKENQLVTWVRH